MRGAFLAWFVALALTDARTVEAMEEAFHDSLTGLPNRALFLDRLQHVLDVAARRATELCVLFVDLDRFKAVNDTLGHRVGDRLLAAVAERLTRCADEAGYARASAPLVARLGGGEFALLVADGPGRARFVTLRRMCRAWSRRPSLQRGPARYRDGRARRG